MRPTNVTPSAPDRRTVALLGGALVCMMIVSGCGNERASGQSAPDSGNRSGVAGGAEEVTAERVMQVTSVHEETGMTLLEGPTFGEDGRLRLVDVTAPAGEPKVLAVDVHAREVSGLYTDETGAYTSAQFSPYDQRLYLTDYLNGRVVSITPDGDDPQEFVTGKVNGRAMQLDDVAFDDQGHLFASDSSPTTYPEGEQDGRVLRFDRDSGEASVLASGLPNPNGISFTRDGEALWVSMLDANRIEHLALDEPRESVEAGHTAIHLDGGVAQTDSNAVDADGNIYQGMHGEPGIEVYAPDGSHLRTITIPEKDGELESATNLAIRPGATDTYVTVSGESGGFLYRFEALAEGVRQSNGG